MRSALSSAAMLAFAALMSAGPATAQSSGWVDPPGRGDAGGGAAGAAPVPTPKPQETMAERPAAKPAEAAQARSASQATDLAAEAPARRPKAAEVRRERRITARAARPSFAPDEAGAGSSAQAGSAQQLTAAYLRTVSAPGPAMVAAVPRFYGERVRFHGRAMTRSALMAEKARFVRRWPERRYAPHGPMRTACNGETCTVRAAFDFRAQNPDSGARSQGSAELTLTIDFGQGPARIVSESSRVLHYGGPLAGKAELPGRGA